MNNCNSAEFTNIYEELGIDREVFDYAEKICRELRQDFDAVDIRAEINQLKVLKAMQDAKVSEASLLGTTGYGYDDIGRDTLEKVYAGIFHTEDALVRPQIVSGTHALSLALSGNLRPGDVLYSPCGSPYDTLEKVIGIIPSRGSLAEYGIGYCQTELLEPEDIVSKYGSRDPDDLFDYDAIAEALRTGPNIKMVAIQRSKGYKTRPSFSVRTIGKVIAFIKEIKQSVIIMVDNCYGEFVDVIEPSDVGADMVVGSLIKNPGGGLAPIGGYIAGAEECVENAAVRLTSPGLGKEVGASLSALRPMYQGLFQAPTVTASALKGAMLSAAAFDGLGYKTVPSPGEERVDIIQSVILRTPEAVVAFCEGIQAAAPVDSFVSPVPAYMPGYTSDVIMAAGAFISGASIELSADAPMREPYAVYFQGGLTFPHVKFGIMKAMSVMKDKGIISIPE